MGASDATMARRACKRCGTWQLHEFIAVVASNGARQIRGRCARCGTESENLRHDALRFMGVDPALVPIDRDYADHPEQRPCVVCGSRYSEFHHWAPQAVFGPDAETYPGDYLCVSCHQNWHRRMSGYQWNVQEASAS